MERKKKMYGAAAALCLLIAGAGILCASLCLHKVRLPAEEAGTPTYIYIDTDDDVDSLRTKLDLGWRFGWYARAMHPLVRTGRYRVEDGMPSLDLYRRLRNGQQEPLRLTLPSVRTLDRLASRLGSQLMLDSATVATAFYDSTFCQEYGYRLETLPALFIPNTYEVYWNISLPALMKRMQQENARFWTKERQAKADALGLTHEQVATLASIVEEETANDGEKPMIAGLYLNRLRKGMLLQADPTVKFAQGNFALRRILYAHLEIDNPYNTYKYKGLPPGPIRIPSIVGLDAVLNAREHPYLYMCAKEDFSGTHNFAATLSEHMRNARRYARALNERGIR